MKPLFTSVIILALFGLGDNRCSDIREFDTEEYHRRTLQLKEDFQFFDSIVQVMDFVVCPELDALDSLKAEYDEVCRGLRVFDFSKKTNPKFQLIHVSPDCVVEAEIVKIKNRQEAAKFREQFTRQDSILTAFSDGIVKFRNELERGCVENLKACKKIRNNPDNKQVLKEIKALLEVESLPDPVFFKDSISHRDNCRRLKRMGQITGVSSVYIDFLFALINDLDFRLSHQQKSNLSSAAHVRWANLEKACYLNTDGCALEHLKRVSQSDWPVVIDSSWIFQRANVSRGFSNNPQGCTCEQAINYNPLARHDNGSCIGCKDPAAENYCQRATQTKNTPCIYAVCKKRCFKEQISDVTSVFPLFKPGRDSLMQVDSLCVTNLCGCLNECADNFNPTATIPAIPDTCRGTQCGCLDPKAVNFAQRQSPPWAMKKYFNPNITEHRKDSCRYDGCKSECAANFDSLALTDNGLCECDSVSLTDLEQSILEIELAGVSGDYSVQNLEKRFLNTLDPSAKRVLDIEFIQDGVDLIVDATMGRMKIEAPTVGYEGIPYGEYHFRPVDKVIDGLVTFLRFESGSLDLPELSIRIVGEADGKQIRQGGIPFKNAGTAIGGRYKIIAPGVPTDPASIRQKNYNLAPDSDSLILQEGQHFYENIHLAFLRGYMVKQKFLDILGSDIEERKILLGARANQLEGKKYRRVSMTITLEGFFKQVSQQSDEDLARKDSIFTWIDFFEFHGWPGPGKTYPRCPCVE